MGLVALFTLRGRHVSSMRFVALGTLRDLAVDVVTGGTVKQCMLALIVSELNNLLSVAGQTSVSDIAREYDIFRRVRVLVTGETAFEFEMGLAHMAVVALWYGFLYCRRMTVVTAYAPYVLVFPPGGFYVGRRSGMTLNTVFICQHRFTLGRRSA